ADTRTTPSWRCPLRGDTRELDVATTCEVVRERRHAAVRIATEADLHVRQARLAIDAACEEVAVEAIETVPDQRCEERVERDLDAAVGHTDPMALAELHRSVRAGVVVEGFVCARCRRRNGLERDARQRADLERKRIAFAMQRERRAALLAHERV